MQPMQKVSAAMADVIRLPIIHRQPCGINLGKQTQLVPMADRAAVVDLRRIRDLLAFEKACREQFGPRRLEQRYAALAPVCSPPD